jgi:hypothetical protein
MDAHKEIIRALEGNEQYTAEGRFAFFCPACECLHSICTKLAPGGGNPVWQFDGNMIAPTINPSIRVRWNQKEIEYCCHSFVRNGFIEFCGDCTHSMKNLRVPLQPF